MAQPPSPSGYVFNRRSVERTVRAVEYVEGLRSSSKTNGSGILQPPKGWWLAEIMSGGPNGEDDYSDPRYWVRRIRCSNDSEDTTEILDTSAVAADEDIFRHLTATNLGEILDDTHDLPTGTIVQVWSSVDQHDPTVRRYWFILPLLGILLAGGSFNGAGTLLADSIASWRNGRWAQYRGLSGAEIRDIVVWNNSIYAAGSFDIPGQTSVAVARWTGTTWALLKIGPDHSGYIGVGRAIAVYDNKLYLGGDSSGGGHSALARWDGAAWTEMPTAGLGGVGAGSVRALRVAAGIDGSNSSLYIGGSNLESVNGVVVNGIGRWDGTNVLSLDVGIFRPSSADIGLVNAICEFNDGGGLALFIGGDFETAGGIPASNVARWRSAAWSAIGAGLTGSGSVLSLHVHDFGSGSRLYVGSSGLSGSPLAVKSGTSWVRVTAGFDSLASGGVAQVASMASWDGGLVCGGGFDRFRELAWAAFGHVVRFHEPAPQAWESLASGVDGPVYALMMYGGRLYAGGAFENSGTTPLDRLGYWNGTLWSPLTLGVNGTVRCFAVFGGSLYIGGDFTQLIGGQAADHLARWDGAAVDLFGGTNGPIHAMVDDGAGFLAIGGAFTIAGGGAHNAIVAYSVMAGWQNYGGGFATDDAEPAAVRALCVHDDGGGAMLYAAGHFAVTIGPDRYYGIARWTGGAWDYISLGGCNGEIYALVSYGGNLYAVGDFTEIGGVTCRNIAYWDGATWNVPGTIGQCPSRPIRGMGVHGGSLYVDGTTTGLGTVEKNVRKWNGAVWSNADGIMDGDVFAFASGDVGDGGGVRLYAAGEFSGAGGASAMWAPANRLMRLTVNGWVPVGGGVGLRPVFGSAETVYCIRVFSVDGDLRLFAGGGFTRTSDTGAEGIALATRHGWRALGVGLRSSTEAFGPDCLVWFDDGTGPALYAGGDFLIAVNATDIEGIGERLDAIRIARWKDGEWSAVGAGLAGRVRVLAVHANQLYAGGDLDGAVKKWDGATWVTIGALPFDPGGLMTGMVSFGGNLYICGEFPPGPTQVWKWDGLAWADISPPAWAVGGSVDGMVVADIDGSGDRLYIVGSNGTVDFLWRYTGGGWELVGSLALPAPGLSRLYAWRPVAEEHDLLLVTGGAFTIAGGIKADVIYWRNATTEWIGLGQVDLLADVWCGLARGQVYAGGDYDGIHAVPSGGAAEAANVARGNGSGWSPLPRGGCNSQVLVLAEPLPPD